MDHLLLASEVSEKKIKLEEEKAKESIKYDKFTFILSLNYFYFENLEIIC